MLISSNPNKKQELLSLLIPNPHTAVANCVFRLISTTLRWEFECNLLENVGLFAGRYSGSSRPDLYRTPQALHSVFGPMGPARHCGVLSDWQCKHLRPSRAPPADVRGNNQVSWPSHIAWSGNSPWLGLGLRLRPLVRGRTGTLRLPFPSLLLLLLFSRTELGLSWFTSSSGLSDNMPKHVSTAGNSSLFDSHSNSSSANS